MVWRALVFIVAIGILIVVATRWTYLQADVTPIATKVSGYLRDLPMQDYDRVHAGQILAQIVDDDYRAAVAQAQANVSSALAQSEALQAQRELQAANVQAARAVVSATEA